MATRVSGSVFLAALLLLGILGAIAQQPSTASSSTHQATAKRSEPKSQVDSTTNAVAEAVRSGKFDLAEGEYKLESSINLESASKGPKLKVDYQIGTIKDKAATVSVLVDEDKAPKKNEADKAEAMFGMTKLGDLHLADSGPEPAQNCSDGKKCVKTDATGHCVKWICK